MARPTYARIDLDAVIHNVGAVKRHTGRGKICAAVKADGYGHGACAVAHAMSAAGVDMFGVAMPEEAVQLRRAGIESPIVLLSASPQDDIETILEFGISACITDLEFAKKMSAAALKTGVKGHAHINIDTGMGRVGLPCKSAARDIKKIMQLAGLQIDGIFTHFACSEDMETSSRQLMIFRNIMADLQSAGIAPLLLHVANSAATLQMPEAHMGCVRPGLILYGLYPPGVDSGILKLNPVLSLHSEVIFCKKVSAGTRLGYGHTFTTGRDSLIATIPLGYHDGYVRQYSNTGEVLINGCRAPVVGRVCMDQTLVDVTEVPGVAVGDEAVIYGRQGEERIAVEEMAMRIDRIPYELTCSIGSRVRRRYILNGMAVGETPMGSLVPPDVLNNIFAESSERMTGRTKIAQLGAA